MHGILYTLTTAVQVLEQLDLANTYDKVSIFYDFLKILRTVQVFYWDNVEFAPLPLAQMDLPVTFDDATVDYGTIDFGGNVSAFVADPADASNNVVQSIKTSGAQTWAGTSLAQMMPDTSRFC